MIGGNGGLVAMRALGWKEADVVELDLTETQATALGIALNRTSELADWDLPTLGRLLESLQVEWDLDGVGYSEKDLQDVLDAVIAANPIETSEDDVPGLPDEATTKPGNLWKLGRHRLLCGDSAAPGDLDRLLARAPIHLLNMEPPYNVKVEPRSNNAIAAGLSSFMNTHHQGLDLARHPSKAKRTTEKLRPKDRSLANDFISDEAFDLALREWFGNAARVLLPGRGFDIWGGYANCATYPSALEEAGLYFSQSIIWDKQHPVLTRKDFMGVHEWCFYGWK